MSTLVQGDAWQWIASQPWFPWALGLLALNVAWAFLVYAIAFERGDHKNGVVTWSAFVFGPLPLIYYLAAGDGPRRPCPRCAERILEAASICRFCGHEAPNATRREATDAEGSPETA